MIGSEKRLWIDLLLCQTLLERKIRPITQNGSQAVKSEH